MTPDLSTHHRHPRRAALLALASVLAVGPLHCSSAGGPPAPGDEPCSAGEVRLEGRCQPPGLPPSAQCAPGELSLPDGACQPAGLPPDMPCPPGELPLPDGACQPAGLAPDMPCPPGELPLPDGACQPAGVPPEACGAGFTPDGRGGCDAVLPGLPCPAGQMAIPGESACHDVSPCGDGTYGDIPVESTTEFVDASYAGGGSDGSLERPWRTIHEAADAAAPGAIVAIAAGRYAGDVVILDKALRLWGRCPRMVEVVGSGEAPSAIHFERSTGSAVRGLAVTGPRNGVVLNSVTEAVVEGVWVHATANAGIVVGEFYGPASATVSRVLVEGAHNVGVAGAGGAVTIEASVVRDTLPGAANEYGRGVEVHPGLGQQKSLVVRSSLIERSRDVGVAVIAFAATIESSVVRDTLPGPAGRAGDGIRVFAHPDTGEPGTLALRSSLVEHNQGGGVSILGGDATIEASVVRDTFRDAAGLGGFGIGLDVDPTTAQRAKLALKASLVERNYSVGVAVVGSEATIESSVVSDTHPDREGLFGRGVQVIVDDKTGARGHLSLTSSRIEHNMDYGVSVYRGTLDLASSLVEQNRGIGVMVVGSDAVIAACAVQGTLDDGSGLFGRGIELQDDVPTGEQGRLTLMSSLVQDNDHGGVSLFGGQATIETSVVRGERSDGVEGETRGINQQADVETGERGTLTVRATIVEQCQAHGIFLAGGDVTIEASVVRDNAAEIASRRGAGIAAQVEPTLNERTNLALRSSLVERNGVDGVFVYGSDATIAACLVRDSQPLADGTFGDGILAQAEPVSGPSAVVVHAAQVTGNSRSGLVFVDSAGELAGVWSTANLIGLVLQGSTMLELGAGNDVSGNSEQDVIKGGDLPLPEAAPPLP